MMHLFVARVDGFPYDDPVIGVYRHRMDAIRAVEDWFQKIQFDSTKRIKIGWYHFVDDHGRDMSNGRELIEGRPFGPNCFFIRPYLLDNNRYA